MRRTAREWDRLLLWGALGPLTVVATTGALLWFIGDNEIFLLGAGAILHDGHAWAAKLLVVLGVAHAVRVWRDNLVDERYRRTYLGGVLLLGVLVLTNATGLAYQAAADADGFSARDLPLGEQTGLVRVFHVALLPIAGLAALAFHVARARRAGAQSTTRPRRAADAIIVLALLSLVPSFVDPVADLLRDWPLGPVADLNRTVVGAGWALLAIVAALVAIQPWFVQSPGWRRSSRLAVVAYVGVSLAYW